MVQDNDAAFLTCLLLILFLFRLRASEDVQYFKFDEFGNMFVYGAGSGFSGPSVKVEPGFQMDEVVKMTQNLSMSSQISNGSSFKSSVEFSQVSSVVSTGTSEVVDSKPNKRYF